MVRVGRVQRRGCVSDRGYYGSGERLEAERGHSPMGGWSAQVASWALRMVNARERSLNLRRQRLSENIGIQAPEVVANGAQKLLIRHHGNSSTALDAASHCRLQITASVKVPRHEWSVNHLFSWLWATSTVVRFLPSSLACHQQSLIGHFWVESSAQTRLIPNPGNCLYRGGKFLALYSSR